MMKGTLREAVNPYYRKFINELREEAQELLRVNR